MADTTGTPSTTARRRVGPTASKLVWLAGLAIAMLIPNYMTSNLIGEREWNEHLAKQTITQGWGPAQTIVGPRFMVRMKNEDTRPDQPGTTYVQFAPTTLDAEIEIAPERRHRGFFEATVYAATIHLKGSFALPDRIRGADRSNRALPDAGFLTITLSDAGGVKSGDRATIDGTEGTWQRLPEGRPGNCNLSGTVLVVPVNLSSPRKDLPFEATLHLRGSEQIAIDALAKAMNTTIKGAWASPSFTGDEPPVKTTMSKDGFLAQWRLDGIDEAGFTESPCVVDRANANTGFGVSLVEPIPIYRMVTRAAKYSPLFVVLAFTAYFVFELAVGATIGVLQYGLLAASLTLFPLLLVSIGEVSSYTTGYIVAAALVVAQASIFTLSVMRRLAPAVGFASLLTGLFSFLYVLLGLENLALLIGAVSLFVVLSVVMAITQYLRNKTEEPKTEPLSEP